ncbi:MAG: methylated-DNA--[protein]-cysteine S-methyltransferase [Alphaproteobacteria bacterium]|nr:methylated-DNA--[protein]-cysteine S-methyltransferase [Alphaproteobacteria bacterium]
MTKDPDSSGDDSPAWGDYDRLERAIGFISRNPSPTPGLTAVAAAAGLKADEWRQLLQRFARLTPDAFLAALSPDHARSLLEGSVTLFDDNAPFRSPFVRHRLLCQETRLRRHARAGEALCYGFHDCPFGIAVVIAGDGGLCGLGFADPERRQAVLIDLQQHWPQARFSPDPSATADLTRRIFDVSASPCDPALPIVLDGTGFELRVWEALLKVPLGRAVTYSDLANAIHRPGAARAVGAAVGRNPISFVVPCHRVLGKAGSLTGYHWGLARKHAILAWEAGCLASVK